MTLTYANMPLDRGTNQRKDNHWLQTQFNDQHTFFCLIKDGKNYFQKGGEIAPYFLAKHELAEVDIDQCVYLGKKPSGTFFAVDFNKLRYSTQEALNINGQWLALKQATSLLAKEDTAILALAKGLVHWHVSHQYCGQCGNINHSVEAGHAMQCSECKNMTFPRTDPVVIMLIERMFDDGVPRCLLGRQANWPNGIYSPLAGFIDPGETLEEAVIREVLEETNIHVENPQYITSQPWPFPASLMIGFTAIATSETIDTSQDDLEQAHWFSREQLFTFEENKDDKRGMGYKMSSGDSISVYLINAWKDKKIGQH